MFGSVRSDQLILHNYCVNVKKRLLWGSRQQNWSKNGKKQSCLKLPDSAIKLIEILFEIFDHFCFVFLTSMGGWPQRTTGKKKHVLYPRDL